MQDLTPVPQSRTIATNLLRSENLWGQVYRC